MERIEAILQFWFGDIDEDTEVTMDSEYSKKWFGKSEELDKEIKKNFEGDVKKAIKGQLDDWADDPRGRLALIILLDQFTRNIYRDSPKAFDSDLKALELSLASLKDGFDGRVGFVERQFMYMPLMHSENLEVQKNSVEVFAKHLEEAERYEDPSVEYFRSVLEYAQKHHDVIERFKRFPHRNKILGRRSTSEELAFLEEPGSSF